MIRNPKKSDTIEVRLPHAVKRAFMEQCRAEGRTASDVVRGYVDAHLAGDAPAPGRLRRWCRPLAAAGMIGAIGLAMPAAVTAAPDFRPSYAAFDRNHDGVLTPDEFGPKRAEPRIWCGEHRVMALPLRRASMPDIRGLRPFAISASDFTLAKADANRDGRVSFAEFAAHRLRMFRAGFDLLDADHDGTLSPAEYAAAWNLFRFQGQQPDVAPFQELDRSGDGKVAWSEFLA
ncbi:Ca2+-binding EF-hand superfamily protein [Sphingomonas kyeonggiensis]|uniref:Ca2+-binding EF-hand superfamily protein n=1 Tax=Sphingomonas kyeonggiensis TaxID=1268553 RepID=A0A7W7K1H9_9SPHN|nr:EF-hand domain-containing protein [Sphingomonas kyeonggiensis]MBB4839306.1 Ca2+-binding EF-hand superfamily protein [Sphingomonas kyeonggiensis]